MYDKALIKEERLNALKLERDKMREEKFAEVEKNYGAEMADALKYLYRIYDERMYLWIAGLWEPEIGAFYFSNSGRDTEGYLPDIESTIQAMRYMVTAGLTAAKDVDEAAKVLSDMKTKIARYAESLQDEDGYFYHPQWGKDITVSRRGRDLGWASGAIKEYGGTFKYPSPLDRQSGSESSSNLLPEHLQSIENLKKYLSERDLMNKSYSVGNLIQSQARQIMAAGGEYIDTVCNWYIENQNPENGLWGDSVCYHTTNGLMKVCLTLSAFEKPIPMPERAIRSCFEVMLSDTESGQITSFYNPWITVAMIISNLRKFGNDALADELHAEFMANAPLMIRKTADKVLRFRRDDGSYSYGPAGCCRTSQGAPVAAPGSCEGDINGNCLATTGVVNNVCRAIGIPTIPFFCHGDGELFFEIIAASYPSKKIYPKPEQQ